MHVTGFAPVHTPAWQLSVCVHALPSLHAVPFGAFGFEQLPVDTSHTPATWHASLAVHTFAVPGVQVPAWQVSLIVQALPSLQLVPFAAAGFEHRPVTTLHVPATWH